MDDRAHLANITVLVRRLVKALKGRGLSAEPFGAAMVWIADRSADPAGAGVRPTRANPDRRWAVLCRADRDGCLGWWWLWTGRGGGLTYEWFGAAEAIGAAADEIARVLAMADGPVER